MNHDLPYAVSLVSQICEVPQNILPVKNDSLSTVHSDVFGVCVPPLHEPFDDALKLVENIEVNRLFGAKHFMFYNYSSGPSVGKILRSYAKDGVAEIIKWNLPLKIKSNIHYFGQLMAINDCLYRLSSKVGYILFADLDEIAVPRKHENWNRLIKYVTKNGNWTSFGSFNFRSTVFPPLARMKSNKTSLLSFREPDSILRVNRSTHIFKRNIRGKVIAVVRKVETCGIHFIWKYYKDYTELSLDVSLGLLHHYRNGLLKASETFTVDKSMHRFRKQITASIVDRLEKVRHL